MRVLVFVLHPTSCPGLGLSSRTTWWWKSRRKRRRRREGCEGIRQPVPSLPGSPRLALCDLITWPLADTVALIYLDLLISLLSLHQKENSHTCEEDVLNHTLRIKIYACMQMRRQLNIVFIGIYWLLSSYLTLGQMEG